MSKEKHNKKARKFSQAELMRREERKKEKERAEKARKERAAKMAEYSFPASGSDEDIAACQKRVDEGKKCLCVERACICGRCVKEHSDKKTCLLESVQYESGCVCYLCDRCNPCFKEKT